MEQGTQIIGNLINQDEVVKTMATIKQIFSVSYMKLVVAFALYLCMGVYFYASNAQQGSGPYLQASVGGTAAVKAELTDIYTNEDNGTSLEFQLYTSQQLPTEVSIQDDNGDVYYPEARILSANGHYSINMVSRLPKGEYSLVIASSEDTSTSLTFTIEDEHALARFR